MWDKSANINFVKPGRGTVYAEFNIEQDEINQIVKDLESKKKVNPKFTVNITDTEGETIAVVEKVLHISKKQKDQGAKA